MSRAIDQLFTERVANRSDINEHMEYLRALAGTCWKIAEFGVRSGNSTVAFLAGLPAGGELYSYDLNQPAFECPKDAPAWFFSPADTGKLEKIPRVDMLFIDTLHTCQQVEAELVHAALVAHLLVFHDTVLFGSRDEQPGNGPGIMHAILCWMATPEGRKWEVAEHRSNNCGLLTLRRR